MQSHVNMPNINAQLKGIRCSNTTKLPTKKISLYFPPLLFQHLANVKLNKPYVGQIQIWYAYQGIFFIINYKFHYESGKKNKN